MNMANDERFEKFYLELKKYFSEITTQLFNGCRDIANEWNSEIDKIESLQEYFDTNTDKIKDFETKLMRKNKKMIVFGETSSGKSTFINALLQRNLLKMRAGATTKCPIKIQLRPDNEEYIIVNEERKSINDLQDLTSFNSPIQVSINGFVNVFINYTQSDLLLTDLEIVDTPGINADRTIDDIVKTECNDADIIIIIINCTSTINMTIKQYCQNINDAFSNITVFIIFNRCEEIDNDDDVMESYSNDAENLLTNILKRPTENKIFFISSKEQLNNESNESTELMDNTRLQRNKNYKNMKHHLQRELEISEFQRKCSYLDGLILLVEYSLSKVKKVITKYESLFNEIITRADDYKLLNTLEYKEKIYKTISDFFENHYEKYLIESIKQYNKQGNNQIEVDQVFGTNCEIIKSEIKHKINENYEKDSQNQGIQRNDSADQLFPNMELAQSENDENLVDMTYFMEEVFSKLIDKEFDEFKNNKSNENFKEINQIIKEGKLATIGSLVGLIIISAATGGILGALAIETAAAIGGGLTAGSAAVAGTTTGFLQFLENPFRYFWRKKEMPIKDNWENFKNDLINKFDEFLQKVCYLIKSIENLRNNLINIETGLRKLKDEFNSFKMESFLYG